jgi:predicted secreted hydrolase
MPRTWEFPRDHGAHPEYRTEWWYFTGNLEDQKGNLYGYQLTFFRHGARQKAARPSNPWSVRDIYLAHFALTDVSNENFWHGEKVSRTGPGLAGAGTETLQTWLLDWSAQSQDGAIRLKAREKGREIDLLMRPQKPVVLHGKDGLSLKGPGEGQASYYYSLTDLKTLGRLRTYSDSKAVEVKGVSWFDHEFGSNQLAPNQEGWDWFSLHLTDGRELMVYILRLKDGTTEPASSGTLVEPDGKARHLSLEDISVEVVDHWQSPRSGGIYPSRWRLIVKDGSLDLTLSPSLADQELITGSSTGVTYWEGAVSGKGTSAGRKVQCKGYVELTGYAGALGSIF